MVVMPSHYESFGLVALEALQRGNDPESLGDSSLLLAAVDAASSHDLARIFGSVFVEGLAEIAPGEWSGPVESGYGLHFVKISAHTPARSPQLDEVRAAVERDLLNARTSQINESFYAALRERYTVRMEVQQPND